MPRSLAATEERWPLAEAFVISRGSKTEVRLVVVELIQDGVRGRGECAPYKRYGETPELVLEQIEQARPAIEAGVGRDELQALMSAGAARNALDCALWDLKAKRTGLRAYAMAGLQRPDPVKTAYTISLGSPEAMAAHAAKAARRPMLKLKLGDEGDLERVKAVRAAAPLTRLIVDANEGWDFQALKGLAPELARLEVKLIEQPLKVGQDAALEGYDSPVPLCADESLHTRAELGDCARRYGCINIKLDKAGDLTEALALAAEARSRGIGIMIGSMVATSLSMAPALILAQGADFVDLDGPLLLARDRTPGLGYLGSMIEPPAPELWG